MVISIPIIAVLITALLLLTIISFILWRGFKFFIPFFQPGENIFTKKFDPEEEKAFKKNAFTEAIFHERCGQNPSFDCIVVGSGISSLVTASILTKMNKKVLILEKHKKIGGALHNFEKFNHYMLVSHIPAIFGENGLLSCEETIKLFEFASDGKIQFSEKSEHAKHSDGRCFGTISEVFPPTADGVPMRPGRSTVPMLTAESFEKLLMETAKTNQEKKIVQEFLEKGKLYLTHRRAHFLMKLVPCPFDSIFHFFNIGEVATAQKILETPLVDLTDQITDNPTLKNLLQCGYGTPLGFLPVEKHSLGHYFATFIHSLRSQSENPPEMHLKRWEELSGNFYKLLVDPIAMAIVSRGSHIFTEADVTQVLFDAEGKKAIGVQVGSNFKIYAPIIITCSNLNHLVSELIPKPVIEKNLYLSKLSKEILDYRPKYQTFFAFFGVKMTEREASKIKGKMFNYILRNHSKQNPNADLKQIVQNYISSPKFEPENLPFINVFCELAALKSEKEEEESELLAPETPMTPITPDPENPNLFMQPNVEKRYLVCVQAPCNFSWFEKWKNTKKGKRGSLYIEQKDAFLDAMLKLLFEAYPVLKGRIAFEPTTCSPLTISHYLGYSYGSTFGSFDADARYFSKIDKILKTKLLEGLYITGQELAGQPGFFAAMVSSLLTASAISGRNLFTDLDVSTK